MIHRKHLCNRALIILGIHLSSWIGIAVAKADVPGVETPDQLQALFDKGQYAQLLAKLNPAINAKMTDADKPARYSLLMLKGEALLQTKASDSAAEAFRAASLIGPDDHAVAMARAMTALIKHSTHNKYQPKARAAGSASVPLAIDIVDTASRKQAFDALFTDLLELAKPQVDRAEKLTTLAPLMEAAAPLADLRPVEIAASGSDAQSKELLKKLEDQASSLMTAALKNMDAQISAISKEAVKRQRVSGVNTRRSTQSNLPQALSNENVEDLHSIVSQSRDMGSVAASMQTTFGAGEDFKTIESKAQKTIDSANKLLKQYDHPATP